MKGENMTKTERTIIRSIQKDTLFWIVRGLRRGSLSQDYVKELADRTLLATRKSTLEACFDTLSQVAEQFSEANDVFIKNARLYYQIVKEARLVVGRSYMSVGDINNAVIALRGGGN